MNTFGCRLKIARKEAKLSQADVQKKIGIKQGTLSELENDLTLKSTYTIALANLYEVNANWLATGKGEKTYAETNYANKVAQFEMPENSYRVNAAKLAYPPVFGKAMGGLPDNLFTDEGRIVNGHDEYGEVYSSDSNAFITRVEGNSMLPTFYDGGYVLVEPNTAPEIEDIVLIKLTTGQVMLKKLISRRGGVVLSSYNDPQIHTFSNEQIVWMYYVPYPVPERKIKNRL